MNTFDLYRTSFSGLNKQALRMLVYYCHTVVECYIVNLAQLQLVSLTSRMVPLFRASEGVLAQLMVTLAATIQLLQNMGILPKGGVCRTCSGNTRPAWRRENTWVYWHCTLCRGAAGKTGLRANTVLANSNIKLERFVILMWHFADRGKTYEQIKNAACLPSDLRYTENGMSSETIAKWNKYFRYICVQDYKKNKGKLGGIGEICEIDETLCGKLKFGKGDPTKRRRCWVFGGIIRATGMAFMSVCPQNKRTKKALWPIILENVLLGTTIYSDGWRAYRKLPTVGYPHRWLDHSQYYVHPDDPTLNTNKIEGFWGNWKRWLPSSGPYNLEQYLYTYLWFHHKKLQKIDPFWALVELVVQNNSIDILEEAMNISADTEGQEYDEEQERLKEAEIARLDDIEYNTDSETDDESSGIPSFSCPFCQKTSETKAEVLEHLKTCQEADIADSDEDINLDENAAFNCPYCQQRYETKDEIMKHMDVH